ncbi:MAG TPA: 5-formyltetrahydrofolate cyclo-ligase [Ferruginibacter sp.]|nr:5-formyltetrahydrofolate cyclo-ligase [Ferruginibacter sp.]HMP22072.1 5-formyltetrahydrofolate cyclo-ligase [Ferruginibacter sp.]
MKKKDIRHIYKEKRLQLTASQQSKMDDLMLIQFQKSVIQIPTLVMTYAPIEKMKEFNPLHIVDYCAFIHPGLYILYPVMVEIEGCDELLSVMVNEDTQFAKSSFGVYEPVNGTEVYPSEIDMVIVPLLAFDKSGYRVGYGKGYYDRFLARCRKDCIKIGFSYFDALDCIEDAGNTDIKLDYCITHEKVYAF